MDTALPIVIASSNLFTALLIVGISIPMLKGSVKPNRLYGVRFKRSFESEAAWYAHNRFGARKLIFWSIPVALCGLAAFVIPLDQGEWPFVVLGCAPLLYLIGCWETYRYARHWTSESEP